MARLPMRTISTAFFPPTSTTTTTTGWSTRSKSGLRILHVIFWPVVIVTGTHMLQEDERTASGYALTVAVMVLIYTVIGARLRNMLLLGCVAGWLAYIVLTQGGMEAEAQGLVIGAAFVLWTAWCEWQRHISGAAEPANEDEDDEDEDEEGEEPGPGKSD